MNLEETLDKVAELSREELGIVRKRGEEKTAAREHGEDFHEMQRAADRLDHTPTSSAGCTTPNSARTGGTRAWGTRAAPPERRGYTYHTRKV